jgi:hypothetical protein
MKFVDDTPTKGRFRQRARNELYFAGSDRVNELPGMYAFWTALVDDRKPWMKRPHEITRVPGRARVGVPKSERFERLRTDAITKPHARKIYRALYKSLKKPLRVRRSTEQEIAWWVSQHPELAGFIRFPKYRKHGVHNPWL